MNAEHPPPGTADMPAQGRSAPGRPGPLGRLGRSAFRHRGRVVLAWVAALGLAFGLSTAFGGSFSAVYSAPASDSQAAQELLEQRFPGETGTSVTLVVQADRPITDPDVTAHVDHLLRDLAHVPHVAAVAEPWADHAMISADGRTGVIDVPLDVATAAQMPMTDTRVIVALAEGESRDGLTVVPYGDVVALTEAPPIGSEGLGLAAAAVILLLTFGSVVAAGLPILIAITGLAVSSLLTVLITAALPVPDWSTSLVAMMTIGVGVDYTLLMVTRYREWRSHGLSTEEATIATMDTAGRSVLLAGLTVVISMLGLAGMGVSFLRGAAVVTIVGVLVVLAAALTLFPALLGYLGARIDRWRIPMPRRTAQPGARWLRWSRLVRRHRYAAVVAGLGIMLTLAAPFLGVHFGSPDAGNAAPGTATRTGYDLIAEGFGPGANGPLLLVLDHPSAETTTRLTSALATTPGVAATAAAVPSPTGDTTLVTVVPTTGPQDPATATLVRQLRDRVLPGALAGTPTIGHVGGATAAAMDSDANVARRIPLLLAFVVGLSALLLLVAFRSIAVAVKAAVMNLLSVAAAYGVVALVLQGGWAGQLVGIDSSTPLPAFVPVLMFAVLFSLSADYEIFLVSRMRAAYNRSGDTGAAIVAGLAGTARVITAAAAIMIAVFAAFIPSTDIGVKVIGVGMASAILIDATVVRMLLVPAVMHLLGRWNWYLPAALDRRLPLLAVEGHEEHYLPVEPAAPAPGRDLVAIG
jgi:RND superfamily putative drug exporter